MTIEPGASALNKSGQALGKKGADTRARALAALERLLVESRGVEPTSAAIARAAGISAPAFYNYFDDVGEAVLLIIQELGARFRNVSALLQVVWLPGEKFERSKAFVEAYMAYWSENAAFLRVRNRLADQGDPRFLKLRVESTRELANALARKISDPPVAGGVNCNPLSMATVLIVALERLATVSVLNLYPDWREDPVDLIAALANFVAMPMMEDASRSEK